MSKDAKISKNLEVNIKYYFSYCSKMNDEDINSGELSGEEDSDALVFHILITEPLTKLKFVTNNERFLNNLK